MYQDCLPSFREEDSIDPVFNHGTHFRNTHSNHRRQYESHGLLAKVFRSWQSRSSAPVNPNSISALKRLARLFHYCTSPLLLHQCVPAKPNEAEIEAQTNWFDNIKAELLTLYIGYLQSLGFQEINERELVPSKQKQGQQMTVAASSSLTSLSSLKLYKCLQRSWVGGIILMELMFHDDKFMVKLFTLESSRLVNQPLSSLEVDSMFSAECARYKDFIHVHSFMHDFHLSLLLEILNGVRIPPARFDTRKLLELCYKRNNPPPSFIRNLLKKGEQLTIFCQHIACTTASKLIGMSINVGCKYLITRQSTSNTDSLISALILLHDNISCPLKTAAKINVLSRSKLHNN